MIHLEEKVVINIGKMRKEGLAAKKLEEYFL